MTEQINKVSGYIPGGEGDTLKLAAQEPQANLEE